MKMQFVEEMAVLRFRDGKMLKGYVENFSTGHSFVTFKEPDGDSHYLIPVGDLKAIFFVRSFDGQPEYRERKSWKTGDGPRGKRIFVRFSDGESLMGHVEYDIPWQKGFFLSSPEENVSGFFVKPVDNDSNNKKVFVVNSAVEDITLVG